MRQPRGFTLIEMMTTIVIIGVLAGLAFWLPRAAIKNANLSRSTREFALLLNQLRSQALADQTDYLVVLVNADHPENCTWTDTDACTRYFILANPQAAWSLSSFDPLDPAANAQRIDAVFMPRGIQFDTTVASAPPGHFNVPAFFDDDLTGSCGGRSCFAIHFEATGRVRGEFIPAPSTTVKAGYAFALTTEMITQSAAAERKGLLITFPTGVVRTFGVF